MKIHRIKSHLLLIGVFVVLALSGSVSHGANDAPIAGDLAPGRRALAIGSILLKEVTGNGLTAQPADESPDRAAALPNRTGEIAFASNRNGGFDIFSQEASGAGEIKSIVASGGDDLTPEWSPDGLKLLYVSDRDGDYEIYVKAVGGQDEKLTDNASDDVHPAWSPNGDRILFASDRSGSYFQIFSMLANGSDVRQVGSIANNHAMYPRYSPDGGRIAFMRASVAVAACQWNWDVWLMDADGSNQQRVISRLGADLYPRWSPDGSQIVFASCRNFLDFDLYSIDTSTGSEQRLTAWFLKNEWAASYAPDGQHLTFSTDYDGNIEVYTMLAQGEEAANLTRHSGDDLPPSWKAINNTPSFSISGSVLDGSGRGIPCVTISAGLARSTTTDSNGTYTLAGLPPATYVVAPSKVGYTLSPASRNISGPPDASGVNFTGSESSARRPILVIPGMFASINWQCVLIGTACEPEKWTWFPVLAESYYRPLLNQLRLAGYDDEEGGDLQVLFYDWRQPMGQNVDLVRDTIHKLKTQAGAARVEVIGHSMGGLLGRAYVQSNICADDVAQLITLGSPHRGAARAYPSWEGGIIYEGGWMGNVDRIVYAIMLYFLDDLPVNTARLAAFRSVKSGQELLPIDLYLFDEENEDAAKPIASLRQRNEYLPLLEAGLPDLFSRTNVSTYLGVGKDTTARFYVHERALFDWPLWEDGKPNWSREEDFDADGDGTVPATSARLPAPAQVRTFANVTHAALPGDQEVRRAIFTTLEIPIQSSAQWLEPAVDAATEDYLVFALDGPAELAVRDSSGRQVASDGVTIPGAQYLAVPGTPFRLVIIPSVEADAFQIAATGDAPGAYRLGLLDTFTPADQAPRDPMAMWDTVKGQIGAGDEVKFAVSTAADMDEPPPLLAVTPVIETPITIGAPTVTGWALPGRAVEVRDANTGALRGSVSANSDGRFVVTLAAPLWPGQRVYPWSDGVAGVSVEATQSTLFLPTIR